MSTQGEPGGDDPLVRPAEAPAQPAPPDRPAGRRGRRGREQSHNMLPPRDRRRFGLERVLVRLVATCGIVGIGVVIAAIMSSNHSQGWLVGVVVSAVSVLLAAILWSSRQL